MIRPRLVVHSKRGINIPHDGRFSGRTCNKEDRKMSDGLDSLVVIFTEFYYWVTVVFMFLIHVGF